ncbi:MAG: NAD(+) diphosphatase, partial [Galactobacter sp.]
MTSTPPLGSLVLTGGRIDRGGQDRRDTAWLAAALSNPATRVLVLVNGTTPVSGDALAAPTLGELPGGAGHAASGMSESVPDDDGVACGATVPDALAAAQRIVWIGRVNDVDWVAADLPEELAWWDGVAPAVGLMQAGGDLERTQAALFAQANAVLNWHKGEGFCPRCGRPTRVIDAGWVRVCPTEGIEYFPRTDPAVIVLITDDQDRVLLGANAAWGGARYSTFAGFVEPGESLEEAVVREVGEEAGLAVTNPEYLGSQPWPFPRSLMCAFHAHAVGVDTAPDGLEILSTRWFTREELAAE